MKSAMLEYITDASETARLLSINKAPYSAFAGYFSCYFPAELLYGFNVHPVRVLGHAINSNKRRDIMNYMCSYLADIISSIEAGNFSYIDHLLLPATCDSMYGARDYVEKRCPNLKTKMFRVPLKFTRETFNLYTAEVEEVLIWLGGERSFDYTLLREALEAGNQMNRKIAKLLSLNGELFKGAVYLKLMMAKSVLPYHLFTTLLDEMQSEVPKQNYNQKRGNIVALGPICDNMDVIDYLNAGHNVLTGFMTTTSGVLDSEVPLEGDLKNSLTKYYFEKAGTATSHDFFNIFIKDLTREITNYSVKGIVYLNYKFCEPHLFFSKQLKNYFKNSNVRFLYLEMEHVKGMDALTQNKIDTFMETI